MSYTTRANLEVIIARNDRMQENRHKLWRGVESPPSSKEDIRQAAARRKIEDIRDLLCTR